VKNKVFKLKSIGEKQSYLTAVLKHRSGGALDDAMINSILLCVYIHRQYIVSTFPDNHSFREAVARAKADNLLMSFISSRAGQPPAAAVIIPPKPAASQGCKRAIYVCTPNLL